MTSRTAFSTANDTRQARLSQRLRRAQPMIYTPMAAQPMTARPITVEPSTTTPASTTPSQPQDTSSSSVGEPRNPDAWHEMCFLLGSAIVMGLSCYFAWSYIRVALGQVDTWLMAQSNASFILPY